MTVLGRLNDEQEIEVSRIFASPCFDAQEPVAHPIANHYEVLAFAGPYSFDGSTLTAFEPIIDAVSKVTPSLVILMGPFFDKNLPALKRCMYTNFQGKDKEFDF